MMKRKNLARTARAAGKAARTANRLGVAPPSFSQSSSSSRTLVAVASASAAAAGGKAKSKSKSNSIWKEGRVEEESNGGEWDESSSSKSFDDRVGLHMWRMINGHHPGGGGGGSRGKRQTSGGDDGGAGDAAAALEGGGASRMRSILARFLRSRSITQIIPTTLCVFYPQSPPRVLHTVTSTLLILLALLACVAALYHVTVLAAYETAASAVAVFVCTVLPLFLADDSALYTARSGPAATWLMSLWRGIDWHLLLGREYHGRLDMRDLVVLLPGSGGGVDGADGTSRRHHRRKHGGGGHRHHRRDRVGHGGNSNEDVAPSPGKYSRPYPGAVGMLAATDESVAEKDNHDRQQRELGARTGMHNDSLRFIFALDPTTHEVAVASEATSTAHIKSRRLTCPDSPAGTGAEALRRRFLLETPPRSSAAHRKVVREPVRPELLQGPGGGGGRRRDYDRGSPRRGDGVGGTTNPPAVVTPTGRSRILMMGANNAVAVGMDQNGRGVVLAREASTGDVGIEVMERRLSEVRRNGQHPHRHGGHHSPRSPPTSTALRMRQYARRSSTLSSGTADDDDDDGGGGGGGHRRPDDGMATRGGDRGGSVDGMLDDDDDDEVDDDDDASRSSATSMSSRTSAASGGGSSPPRRQRSSLPHLRRRRKVGAAKRRASFARSASDSSLSTLGSAHNTPARDGNKRGGGGHHHRHGKGHHRGSRGGGKGSGGGEKKLDWVDVTARLGIRLLNSDTVVQNIVPPPPPPPSSADPTRVGIGTATTAASASSPSPRRRHTDTDALIGSSAAASAALVAAENDNDEQQRLAPQGEGGRGGGGGVAKRTLSKILSIKNKQRSMPGGLSSMSSPSALKRKKRGDGPGGLLDRHDEGGEDGGEDFFVPPDAPFSRLPAPPPPPPPPTTGLSPPGPSSPRPPMMAVPVPPVHSMWTSPTAAAERNVSGGSLDHHHHGAGGGGGGRGIWATAADGDAAVVATDGTNNAVVEAGTTTPTVENRSRKNSLRGIGGGGGCANDDDRPRPDALSPSNNNGAAGSRNDGGAGTVTVFSFEGGKRGEVATRGTIDGGGTATATTAQTTFGAAASRSISYRETSATSMELSLNVGGVTKGNPRNESSISDLSCLEDDTDTDLIGGKDENKEGGRKSQSSSLVLLRATKEEKHWSDHRTAVVVSTQASVGIAKGMARSGSDRQATSSRHQFYHNQIDYDDLLASRTQQNDNRTKRVGNENDAVATNAMVQSSSSSVLIHQNFKGSHAVHRMNEAGVKAALPPTSPSASSKHPHRVSNISPSRTTLPLSPTRHIKHTDTSSSSPPASPQGIEVALNKHSQPIVISTGVKRRAPLAPGIKIVVPIFPPSATSTNATRKKKKKISHDVPNSNPKHKCSSYSWTGFYQMATVVSCRRIYVPQPRDIGSPTAAQSNQNLTPSRRPLSLLGGSPKKPRESNTLALTVIIDRSILRNGSFAQMHLRIPDSAPKFPRHSKFPIGSCVATSFGIGVLVGWRVEDDVHVVRSLWKRRGPGTASAYLHRNNLFGIVEAAVGFNVHTTLGRGVVLGYVNGGRHFLNGRYLVQVRMRNHRGFNRGNDGGQGGGGTTSAGNNGLEKSQVIGFTRNDMFSCPSAKFIPIIEQIREAANFEMQWDTYQEALRLQRSELRLCATGSADSMTSTAQLLGLNNDEWMAPMWWLSGLEKAISCLFKAVAEDPNFDKEMNSFVANGIRFLERFDFMNGFQLTSESPSEDTAVLDVPELSNVDNNDLLIDARPGKDPKVGAGDEKAPSGGFWLFDTLFGGVICGPDTTATGASRTKMDDLRLALNERSTNLTLPPDSGVALIPSEAPVETDDDNDDETDRPAGLLRTLMRAVTIARVDAESDQARIALSSTFEVLVFLRTCWKLRKKNLSPVNAAARSRTIRLVKETWEPMQHRIAHLGSAIAKQMERKGKRARAKLLRLLDMIIRDDSFLHALEQGEWDRCTTLMERFIVKARILDSKSCAQFRKSITIIYTALVPKAEEDSSGVAAAGRSRQKIAFFAKVVKWMATPKRTILQLLKRDDVLEVIERMLVRVFRDKEKASQMLNIYAFNFHSFRHLFMLRNMYIARDLWIPLLEAAHEEFAWAVSRMSDSAREFGKLISKLFALGVLHFKVMWSGDASEWMDFLMEDNAISIIQEFDKKVLELVETFCSDLKATIEVLPYYSSFDDDLLELLDKVNLNKLLKEAAEALVDRNQFAKYLNKKCIVAIDRFLEDLPKMRIPLERREISDGWVLTCRGKDGGDLALSHVNIKRENMTCRVMGSGNKLATFPPDSLMKTDQINRVDDSGSVSTFPDGDIEISVLDDVRVLLLNAQQHGCWAAGTGGVGGVKPSPYVASALKGLAVSEVLNTAIELWRNLELDDDELMEIAIRDVSYQIRLQKEREETKQKGDKDMRSGRTSGKTSVTAGGTDAQNRLSSSPHPTPVSLDQQLSSQSSDQEDLRGFNPRKDPTVLFLEMTQLSCKLDQFKFRIEPKTRLSRFDPVFEGTGTLTINNVSIKLGLECRKERIVKLGSEVSVPVLQLQVFDIKLDEVKLVFRETGFDWLLNPVVTGLSDNITEIIEINLKEQLEGQLQEALEHVNSFIEVNPHILMHVLGITMDDLEENVVWV